MICCDLRARHGLPLLKPMRDRNIHKITKNQTVKSNASEILLYLIKNYFRRYAA